MQYDIFDQSSLAILVDRSDLEYLLKRISFTRGFKLCFHDYLIDNLTAINKSERMDFVKSPDALYSEMNTRGELDTVIVVEGEEESLNEYFDQVSPNSVMSFNTYSYLCREEVKNMKKSLWSKVLLDANVIADWKVKTGVDYKNTSAEFLWDYIAGTDGFKSFVDSIDDDVLDKYIGEMLKLSHEFVLKFRDEIIKHYKQIVESRETITLLNPVIESIYMLNSYVREIHDNFPRLKIIPVNKKSLTLLGALLK